MAAKKKVGDLIKEARTNAGLSQEKLAQQVEGVSASDISKAERGEKALTQAALKAIAKATGVTQKSLLEAPAGATAAKAEDKPAAKKTETAAKTSTAAKKTTTAAKKTETAAKTSTAAKKTTTAAKKTETAAKKTSTAAKKPASGAKTTAATTSVKLTAAEKRVLELYRKADAETKKAVEALLKGEKDEEDGGIVESLLGGAMNLLNTLGK